MGEVFVDRGEMIFQRFVSVLIHAVEQFDSFRFKLRDAALHGSDADSEIRRRLPRFSEN